MQKIGHYSTIRLWVNASVLSPIHCSYGCGSNSRPYMVVESRLWLRYNDCFHELVSKPCYILLENNTSTQCHKRIFKKAYFWWSLVSVDCGNQTNLTWQRRITVFKCFSDGYHLHTSNLKFIILIKPWKWCLFLMWYRRVFSFFNFSLVNFFWY